MERQNNTGIYKKQLLSMNVFIFNTYFFSLIQTQEIKNYSKIIRNLKKRNVIFIFITNRSIFITIEGYLYLY
jgi:hypothetical protein